MKKINENSSIKEELTEDICKKKNLKKKYIT